MATFYVAKTGNDSNPGTLGSPKLTIPGAQLASALGDSIYIRKGVYTETWHYNRTFGRVIASYQGEDVTVDCQSARDQVAGQDLDAGAQNAVNNIGIRLYGIKFVNYNVAAFTTLAALNFGASVRYEVINCFFKPTNSTNTYSTDFLNLHGSNGLVYFENNSYVGHRAGVVGSANIETFINNAFKGNTFSWEVFLGFGTDVANSATADTERGYNAFPGNTVESNGINTSSSPFSFNNEAGGDYSLPPTSALRGAGKYGGNIGASFNPRVNYDNVYSDLLLSSGVNDEDYYDTGLNQPGTEGPGDAGPAIFSAGNWKIDNVSEPGAKSARVHFGPFTLPSGSRLTVAGWSALEDTSPSSGSKMVIDNSAGTSTREIHIAIDAGAKQLVSKVTNINTNATTVDFYLTIRIDGQ
jgi:hypothetical protein